MAAGASTPASSRSRRSMIAYIAEVEMPQPCSRATLM